MPRRSRSKPTAAATPATPSEEADVDANACEQLSLDTSDVSPSKKTPSQNVETSSTGSGSSERSRRSTTVSQTAASQASARVTRSATRGPEKTTPQRRGRVATPSEPLATRVKSLPRRSSKVSYEESDGEEEGAAKEPAVEDEEEFMIEDDADTDSEESRDTMRIKARRQSGSRTKRKSGGGGSGAKKSRGRPSSGRGRKARKAKEEEDEVEDEENVEIAEEEVKPKSAGRGKRSAGRPSATKAKSEEKPTGRSRKKDSETPDGSGTEKTPTRRSSRARKSIYEEFKEDEEEEMEEQDDEVVVVKGSRKRKAEGACCDGGNKKIKGDQDGCETKMELGEDEEAEEKTDENDDEVEKMDDDGKKSESKSDLDALDEHKELSVGTKTDKQSVEKLKDEKLGEEEKKEVSAASKTSAASPVAEEKKPVTTESAKPVTKPVTPETQKSAAKHVTPESNKTIPKPVKSDPGAKPSTVATEVDKPIQKPDTADANKQVQKPSTPEVTKQNVAKLATSEKSASTESLKDSPKPANLSSTSPSKQHSASIPVITNPSKSVTSSPVKPADSTPDVGKHLLPSSEMPRNMSVSPQKSSLVGSVPVSSNSSAPPVINQPTPAVQPLSASSGVNMNRQNVNPKVQAADAKQVSQQQDGDQAVNGNKAAQNSVNEQPQNGPPTSDHGPAHLFLPGRVVATNPHAGTSSGIKFGVVSYNLGGIVASNRHDKLLYELKTLNAELICFQEVTADYYNSKLQSSLDLLGYKGDFHSESGLVTVCRTSSAKLRDSSVYSSFTLYNEQLKCSGLSEDNRKLLSEHVQTLRDTLGSIQLTTIIVGEKLILIGNCHLKPCDISIHTMQACLFIKLLEQRSKMGNMEAQLLCGTFNLDESSPGYQLMRDGCLNNDVTELLRKEKNVVVPNKENDCLVNLLNKSYEHNSSNLKSSYATILGHELQKPATISKPPSDSFWFDDRNLKLVSVLDVDKSSTTTEQIDRPFLKVDLLVN